MAPSAAPTRGEEERRDAMGLMELVVSQGERSANIRAPLA